MIGKGGFGEVWKASRLVAIKRVYLPNMPNSDIIKREMEILKYSHPNLIEFEGFYYSEDKHLNIIMELCDISLYDLLHKQQTLKLNVAEKIQIVQNVCTGLEFLHENGIIHRDLKSQNILIKYIKRGDSNIQFLAKIADFGLSRELIRTDDLTRNIGTPIYAAPEMLSYKEYDFTADIFSLGIIIHELFSEKIPYSDYTISDKISKIIYKNLRPNESLIIDNTPIQIKDIITRCLSSYPKLRPSLREILDSLKNI